MESEIVVLFFPPGSRDKDEGMAVMTKALVLETAQARKLRKEVMPKGWGGHMQYPLYSWSPAGSHTSDQGVLK